VVVEVQPGGLAIMAPAMFILMGLLTILSRWYMRPSL
jgi:hypothetical protein